MMEKSASFLIDPINMHDHKQLEYAQDVFISRVMLQQHPSLCRGPLVKGVCTYCGAPTSHTPHTDRDDMMHFSSTFEALPDLMNFILSHWTLQDIRLLGKIMRLEDPLELSQDVIHVYQKRHPYPLGSPAMERSSIVGSSLAHIERDYIRCLAQDMYFFPIRERGLRSETYTAKLLIGRVVAHLQLSSQALRAGHEDLMEQWVIFDSEQVYLALAGHPEWHIAWYAAWETYIQAMEKMHQEEEQARQEFLQEEGAIPPDEHIDE
jgi:hypothetical protein